MNALNKDSLIAILMGYLDICDKSAVLDQMPEAIKYLDLNNLSGDDISELLVYHPELANKIDFDINNLNTTEIEHLLKYQPQLIEKCDPIELVKLFNKIDEWGLVEILRTAPKLITFIDTTILKDWQWERILDYQPQLAKYRNKEED